MSYNPIVGFARLEAKLWKQLTQRQINRKLLVAWGAMLTAIFAAGGLGYALGLSYEPDPLVFGDQTCTVVQRSSTEIWVCQRSEDSFLVIPLKTYVP